MASFPAWAILAFLGTCLSWWVFLSSFHCDSDVPCRASPSLELDMPAPFSYFLDFHHLLALYLFIPMYLFVASAFLAFQVA